VVTLKQELKLLTKLNEDIAETPLIMNFSMFNVMCDALKAQLSTKITNLLQLIMNKIIEVTRLHNK
jgi:hypothetical protein